MTKSYCDICGKPSKIRSHLMHVKEVNCGCDTKDIDMCPNCEEKYRALEKRFDTLFVNNHGNVTVS